VAPVSRLLVFPVALSDQLFDPAGLLVRQPTWHTHDFMERMSAATAGRFQLTTDAFNAYPDAMEYNL